MASESQMDLQFFIIEDSISNNKKMHFEYNFFEQKSLLWRKIIKMAKFIKTNVGIKKLE